MWNLTNIFSLSTWRWWSEKETTMACVRSCKPEPTLVNWNLTVFWGVCAHARTCVLTHTHNAHTHTHNQPTNQSDLKILRSSSISGCFAWYFYNAKNSPGLLFSRQPTVPCKESGSMGGGGGGNSTRGGSCTVAVLSSSVGFIHMHGWIRFLLCYHLT